MRVNSGGVARRCGDEEEGGARGEEREGGPKGVCVFLKYGTV